MKGGYDKAMADLELEEPPVETSADVEADVSPEPPADPGVVVAELRAKLDELEAAL